jgi:hypothetical protein
MVLGDIYYTHTPSKCHLGILQSVFSFVWLSQLPHLHLHKLTALNLKSPLLPVARALAL